MTESTINFLFTLAIMFATYKCLTHLDAYLTAKYNKRTSHQINFLLFLILMIACFTFGDRNTAWFCLSTFAFLSVSLTILTALTTRKLRRDLMRNYIEITITLHDLKKTGWDKSWKADNFRKVQERIWQMLTPKDKELLTSELPQIIESWDKKQESPLTNAPKQ